MPKTIHVGAVLITEFTAIPEAVPLTSETYLPGWQVVKNLDAYALDRRFREAGWNFFYLANEINVIVLGLDRQRTIRKAIGRIVARLDTRKFNALEITSVDSKRFLGLLCVRVAAHPRHIQEGIRISHTDDSRNLDPNKDERHPEAVAGLSITIRSNNEEPLKRLSSEP